MPASDNRPLIVTNARLVDPASGRDATGALLVRNGVIEDLSAEANPAAPDGAEVVNAGGNVLAPGLVDMRAFIGEPGFEHRENIASASLAAAAGGVTSVVCTPETEPAIDDPALVDFLMRRANDDSLVRIYPAAALTKGLQGQEMAEIGLLKAAGAVAFTDGAHTVTKANVFARALTYARDFGALVMHHTEDPTMSGGAMNAGEFASRLGLSGRSTEAETIVVERDVRLARMTRGRYHAAILTCQNSLDVIRRAKDEGLAVTCGTSINHLSFNETDIGDYRTFFKLAPPLRTEDERLNLVEALSQGLIDVVVSDHTPQDAEQKRQPFSEAAHGAIGLETMLVAGLRLVHAGQIALPALLRAMSTRPAELLGIAGGRLEKGAPADLILFDPEEPWVLDRELLKSRSKNTPFDEARLQGRVLRTLVGGRTVHRAA